MNPDENTDTYVHMHIITRDINAQINTYLGPIKVGINVSTCFLNEEA